MIKIQWRGLPEIKPKKNKKIWAVIISSGSYDDYLEEIQFVTEYKEIAEKYVEKYNRILHTYQKFYSDEKNMYKFERYWTIQDINEAFFTSVEMR